MTIDLNALRELADRATPGPWTADVHSADDYDDSGSRWGDLRGPDMARSVFCVDLGDFYALSPENAAFIAASRTAVPALIAEVERLKALTAEACGIATPRHRNMEEVKLDADRIAAIKQEADRE